ncbi:MAG: glycosyltransferase family 4 protein [Muribaculaceae bacterium]|nr:glycosyltransferase family 4 protein [Muribaculaceae bacterium]
MKKRARAFFIDEHDSSKQNGIGTFRDLLLPRLAAEPGVEVALISLNSDYSEPTVTKREFGREYSLPLFDGGRWRVNGRTICRMLRKKIRDSRRNVFIINHSPCVEFIREIKSAYPESKVAFIIHDQGWCAPLLGCRRLFREIVTDGIIPDTVSEKTASHIRSYTQVERDIYAEADRVVCLSPSTHTLLREVYGTEAAKISLIPNGYAATKKRRPSKPEARKALDIAPDEKLLIFAGRPARYKGIEALLMAMKRLRAKDPKLRCVMCGHMGGFGDFGPLLRKVASGLIFTGLIPKNELRKWYAAADVGVMPSYSEQFGYSAMEMAESGLRLVTSDGPGLCDIFKDGENAFVAEIGSDVTDFDRYSRSLQLAIEQALHASPQISRKIIARCRKTAREDYSADKMASGYASMIHAMVSA